MKYLIVLIFAVLYSKVDAQLIVDSIESQYLPAYDFFGPDYTVSNVTYVGHWRSYGQFDGTNSNLGLNKGFFITTGDRETAAGPNLIGNSGFETSIPGFSPLLDQSSSQPLTEGATISFDIVPHVDSLYFRFVFASEEYDEFVGSSFNDRMAIFIEGPGFQVPTNIGLLPTGDPITINNVHDYVDNNFGTFGAVNSQYFVNNQPDPMNFDSTRIGFDGFTQGTFFKLLNIPIGSTYTITITVADVIDGLYDSAIFLESCETCNYSLNVAASEISDFEVFPNPITSNMLHVKSEGQHTYKIFDLTGKVILSGSFQNEHDIDVSNLSKGAYVLHLENGAFQRIIKE